MSELHGVSREALEAAAAAASEAGADAQTRRLRELAARDRNGRWMYKTAKNIGHVEAGLVNAELGGHREELGGMIETLPVRDDGVPIDVQVTTEDDESIGALVHLSPDQAEALAVDLLEQAHAARKAEADE